MAAPPDDLEREENKLRRLEGKADAVATVLAF